MFDDPVADVLCPTEFTPHRSQNRNSRRERLQERVPIAEIHEILAQHTIAALNVLRAFFASVMVDEDDVVIDEALRDTVRDYLA
jgi:hypothetical protein